MSTYAIKWLKDKLGTRFFPVTHINAVRDDTGTSLSSMLEAKQDTLVSGTNIKTVNNNSLVGSGNVSIATGDTNVIETVKVNNAALTPDANKAVNITAVTTFNGSSGAVTYTAPVTSVNGETGAVTLSIPSEVTESTVSGWGFTKNTGTITGITMNGTSKGTSGVVNLGTVITSHQDISGKADKSTTTTAGTYKSVTVDSSGIVTGGSNPTTIAGYGITDAYTKNEVDDIVDDYLPLSGGTMSGNITMGKNAIVFNVSTDASWNVNSGAGLRILNTIGASAEGAFSSYAVALSVAGYYRFQIAGNASDSTDFRMRFGSGDWYKLFNSGNSNLSTVNWACKNLTAAGTVTQGSDARVKDAQKEISTDDAIAVMEKLRPKTWTWNDKMSGNSGKKSAGLVAQEVKEIVPDAVTVSEMCDIEDFHSLNYTVIQGYEIAAIKGLIQENAQLKKELTEIKEMLKRLL